MWTFRYKSFRGIFLKTRIYNLDKIWKSQLCIVQLNYFLIENDAVKWNWALDNSSFLVCVADGTCEWVQLEVDDAGNDAVRSLWKVSDVMIVDKVCDEWTLTVMRWHWHDESSPQNSCAISCRHMELVKMDGQSSSCGCVNFCCSRGSRHSNPVDFEVLISHHQQLSTHSTNSAPSSSSAHQTADSTRKLSTSMTFLTSRQMRGDAATTPQPTVVCHCHCACSPQLFSTLHLFVQKFHWTNTT